MSNNKRTYVVTVNRDVSQRQDYAKALESGLVTSTIKDYVRNVISRAMKIQNTGSKRCL